MMRVLIKKRGNSASVRIPASIMQAVSLGLNDAVDVREEGGRIIIEPIRQAEYDLIKLLSAINIKNLHDQLDFGASTGKEALK
jgi:antitoxin MazE